MVHRFVIELVFLHDNNKKDICFTIVLLIGINDLQTKGHFDVSIRKGNLRRPC